MLHCSLLAGCFGLVGQTGQLRLLAAVGEESRESGRELLLHCSLLAGCFGPVGRTGQLRLLAAVGVGAAGVREGALASLQSACLLLWSCRS